MYVQKKQMQGYPLDDVEAYLNAAMKPVAPRPAFVTSLQSRLASATADKRANRVVFQYVLLSIAGIAGSALVIAAGLRAVVAVVAAIGIFRLARNQDRRRSSTAISS